MCFTLGKYLLEFPLYISCFLSRDCPLHYRGAYRVKESGCRLGGNIRLYLSSVRPILAEAKANERGLRSTISPTSQRTSLTCISTLSKQTTSKTRDGTTC